MHPLQLPNTGHVVFEDGSRSHKGSPGKAGRPISWWSAVCDTLTLETDQQVYESDGCLNTETHPPNLGMEPRED
jgi:hypothetical protein